MIMGKGQSEILEKELGQTYECPRSDDVEEIKKQFKFYGYIIFTRIWSILSSPKLVLKKKKKNPM